MAAIDDRRASAVLLRDPRDVDGRAVGTVTSGMRSPTLGSFIGLGYVTSGVSAPATPIAVEIRGRHVPGRIVNRPFYRRVRQEQAR